MEEKKRKIGRKKKNEKKKKKENFFLLLTFSISFTILFSTHIISIHVGFTLTTAV